jgi:hypothetical protein
VLAIAGEWPLHLNQVMNASVKRRKTRMQASEKKGGEGFAH